MWVGRAEEFATGVRNFCFADHPSENLQVETTAAGPVSSIRRHFPVAYPQEVWHSDVGIAQENQLTESKLDLLQGTLDLMVLQTLTAMGPLHGYGIARRIEQVSGDKVLLNQGTIYASLVRLQQRGWIAAEWGTSSNNRKAKFYSITRNGRKQLAEDAAHWARLARVMGRVLALRAEGEL